MYFLYSLLLAVVFALGFPYWAWRLASKGKYRTSLRARLGKVPSRLAADAGKAGVWVHAVSVGEVLAVSRLVDELRKRFPEHAVYVSTTTATGQELARQRWGDANVFFCPLDFNFALRPYFTRLRPRLLVLAETEFWPNLLRSARRYGARVAVINARISDRSYPRYRWFRSWWKRVLSNVDLFLAQSSKDQERLQAIGVVSDRIRVAGNLKFDVAVTKEATITQSLRTWIAPGTPVIVCGSTVAREEEIVLSAFGEVLARFPNALLILAPRRPERFVSVSRLVGDFAQKHERTFCLRSILLQDEARDRALRTSLQRDGGVLLLDSIGELASVYALGTVAFVGGSLVNAGGHSILEPAQFGLPIVVGPHTQNFREIVSIFRSHNAVREVDAGTFAEALLHLLANPEERVRLGAAARAVFLGEAGATERTLAALESMLRSSEMPERVAESRT